MMGRSDPRAPQAMRDRLQALVDHHGRARAATFLGISPQTLKVVLLDGNVMAGTVALLEKKIAERDAAGKAP